MHANISTGKYPAEHGFISKTGKDGIDGLEAIQEQIKSGTLISIASMAKANSFPVYAIGGKPETIKVMGSAEQCALRVNYDATRGLFLLDGYDENRFNSLQRMLEADEFRSHRQEELDDAIFNIGGNVVRRANPNKSLFIFTLPSLDSIGHKYGPGSQQIVNHLSVLDAALLELFDSFEGDTPVIVMGDHGCRTTIDYAIQASASDPRQLAVYRMDGGLLKFEQYYALDLSQCLRDIQFDGGILRMWYDARSHMLSPDDYSFLSRFGAVCSARYDFPEELVLPYQHSAHPNLGDAVVVANKGVTFCKRRWIHSAESRMKISSREVLYHEDVPIGEHGTFHEEDRHVLLLSNHMLGRHEPIENTKIRRIIEEMMQDYRYSGSRAP